MACTCSGNSTASCGEACSVCGDTCSPNTPTPYYNQAGAVQECHSQPYVQQILVAALSSGTDFIMPACGVETVVSFYGLTVLQIGSYLWNEDYGYLRVTAFNSLSGETKVINDCLAPNAAPGTLIPRCTLFTPTAPPWNACIQCTDTGYIFVFPAGPCPIPAGDPFSLDIDTIVGNVITLKWHSVAIVP